MGLLVIGFTTLAGAQALMFDFDNNGFGEGPFGPAHAEFNGDGVLNEDVDIVWNLTDFSGYESDEIENDVTEEFELGDNYAKFHVTVGPNESLVVVSERLPPVGGSGQFNAIQIIARSTATVLQAGDAN